MNRQEHECVHGWTREKLEGFKYPITYCKKCGIAKWLTLSLSLIPLSAIDVAVASEAFTLVFDKNTVDAPEAFWAELDNAPAIGGID